ncbi:PREDICTED: intracellular protein transport protein USO1-like [Prunus mume]|uniref:Intracellular protein transport protein USO1-like n=1 Tax=Prunus mume TaxID=102107 RepID=A0ABM0PCD4_PRUMU|nr:PREDICTED: intracellular protein transport protein USO1-like [Prunus mume]
MDLELRLKITQTMDDHVSSANFRIAKDNSDPLFVSKETETTFVLTGHLKGYRRQHIEIDINEDGTQIAISGKKPVQEKVMIRRIMYKKEVEIGSFRKVFRIPDGVVLDRIKAKFKEHESTLTIVMPKSEKGIREVGIEEVKDDGVDKGLETQQMAQPAAEEVPEKNGSRGKVEVEFVEAEEKKMEENRQIKGKEVDEEVSKKETVADGVLGKDMGGGKNQEEARASKIQSMQETEKSVSRNREEPKKARIAKIEEADGVEKETVARKELGTEQIVTDYKVPKTEDAKETMKEDTGTQVSQEVAKPSQETQATIHHTEQKGSELPKLEEQVQKQRSPEADQSEKRNAGLEDDIRSRRESSDSSKPAGDTITTQQEAQAQQIETTDGISTEGDVAQLQKQEPIKEGPASNQLPVKGEGSHGNEIQEAGTNEEHMKEEEVEKSSDDLEKTPPCLEKSNLLCSPFIIAGSALIVSLVMVAINRIRTRKR